MRHIAKSLCVCECKKNKKYLSVTFNLIYQCPQKCYSLQQSCRQTTLDIKMVQQAIYSILSVTNILRVFSCFCVCVRERTNVHIIGNIQRYKTPHSQCLISAHFYLVPWHTCQHFKICK